MKLITGTSNKELAKEIAEELHLDLTPITIKEFADGEIYVRVEENVRGENVFVIQSISPPVNKNLMQLLIIIDALKRASAKRITIVIPYYGYARQDRKARAREPISAKLVADLIQKAGATHIVTLDLHANQIQGYFDIPVDDVWAASTLAHYFKEQQLKDLVIVSPDAGGVTRARYFGTKLNAPIALIDKRRGSHNESEVVNIVGDIEGKNALIIDDIIDTAGTITNACNSLIKKGAKNVYLVATHGLFSGPAWERLKECEATEIVVTNSIQQKIGLPENAQIISVGTLLATAIKHAYEGGSISKLLDREFIARKVKKK